MMNAINFANIFVLIIYTILTFAAIIYGFIRKKSIFPLIIVLTYIILLGIHVILNKIYVSKINIIVDFVGLVLAIPSYLIVDEIEIRREKINNVFENKYKE